MNERQFSIPSFALLLFFESPPQIRAEAAYLYDAVHLYAKALIIVLREGGNPRNGTAIIEQIKGQKYLSAMGYMVQIDENADASGNYTLLALTDDIVLEHRNGSVSRPVFGLVPVGTFGASDKNKLPVCLEEKHLFTTHAQFINETFIYSPLKNVELFGDIYWVAGRPPIAEPPCGFRGEKCISE